MIESNNEDAALKEAIKTLLKTAEELKSSVIPIGQGQVHVLEVLKKHQEAIESLMSKLVGTQEEHIATLARLELAEKTISTVVSKQENLQDLQKKLEERLKKLEFRRIRSVIDKIVESIPLTPKEFKRFDALLESYPDNEILLSLKAEALSIGGKEEQALKFLDEVLNKNPNSAHLWYQKGAIQPTYEEALKSFDSAFANLKEDSGLLRHLVLFAQAAALANLKRFDEALVRSTMSLEAQPNCHDGWVQKGIILFELKRIPEALGCFEKATELDSKSADAWIWRGNMLLALGPNYVSDALSSFDKAIEIEPKNADAFFSKAKVFIVADQYEKALQCFDEGLKFDAKNACAWCERGIALNKLKKNDEASQSFEKSLELSPPKDCGLILLNAGMVQANLGNESKALEFAKRAV